MVIMAQALVSTPKVLLLDEPTSALDLKHQLQVMEIARTIPKKQELSPSWFCMICTGNEIQ
ncbi:Hemin import ATP-binding protein HmuV [Fusobacterium necrophorum subsp. necrophorum]|nr:Hemin import ATP-binding protein HmuV [Fusobacterium necrophorum subsp. necrophorum]